MGSNYRPFSYRPELKPGQVAFSEPATATRWIGIGNSTTATSNSIWLAGVATYLSTARPSDDVVNAAEGGRRTQYFIDNFTTYVTNNLHGSKRNVILFWEGAQQIDDNFGDWIDGVNSPPGHGWSSSTAGANGWDKTREFGVLVRATGAKFYVLTLNYWHDGEQDNPSFRAAFDAYNAQAIANPADYDRLLDISAILPRFDPDNDQSPPWYDGTLIHNTTAGGNEIKNRVISTLGI